MSETPSAATGTVLHSAQPTPFTLAANAEMIYTELPIEQRVQILHDAGFGVEIWDWTAKDLHALAATPTRFSSMTGYISGNLTDTEGSAELLETAEQSLRAAQVIDCPRLNLHGTGLGPDGLPVHAHRVVSGKDWLAALHTLEKIAHLGERYGRVFTLENLNQTVDHPGVPFARAEDTLALVQAVDSEHLRLNLDLYHAQIGEGNLIDLCRRALPWVGEIQVADVPGRCEPGTGEVNYPRVAQALADFGYTGVIAMEAFAFADTKRALEQFRHTFTLPRA